MANSMGGVNASVRVLEALAWHPESQARLWRKNVNMASSSSASGTVKHAPAFFVLPLLIKSNTNCESPKQIESKYKQQARAFFYYFSFFFFL